MKYCKEFAGEVVKGVYNGPESGEVLLAPASIMFKATTCKHCLSQGRAASWEGVGGKKREVCLVCGQSPHGDYVRDSGQLEELEARLSLLFDNSPDKVKFLTTIFTCGMSEGGSDEVLLRLVLDRPPQNLSLALFTYSSFKDTFITSEQLENAASEGEFLKELSWIFTVAYGISIEPAFHVQPAPSLHLA